MDVLSARREAPRLESSPSLGLTSTTESTRLECRARTRIRMRTRLRARADRRPLCHEARARAVARLAAAAGAFGARDREGARQTGSRLFQISYIQWRKTCFTHMKYKNDK